MSAAVQHTLAGPATLEGTSLHTGQKVTLTLKPAPEGHGFKFRRIDLSDQPFINADVDKVQTVERATTLAEGSVKVHTVEHVISALVGMGVDNALIEMDANEPPIGDGSSRPFAELIKKVGLVAQSDTADLMLPLVMAMRWATAVGEKSSNSSKTTDAATCIAHKAGARGSMARALSLTRRVHRGGGLARRGVGPHLGRLANAEMAGREARRGHRVQKRSG